MSPYVLPRSRDAHHIMAVQTDLTSVFPLLRSHPMCCLIPGHPSHILAVQSDLPSGPSCEDTQQLDLGFWRSRHALSQRQFALRGHEFGVMMSEPLPCMRSSSRSPRSWRFISQLLGLLPPRYLVHTKGDKLQSNNSRTPYIARTTGSVIIVHTCMVPHCAHTQLRALCSARSSGSTECRLLARPCAHIFAYRILSACAVCARET